MPGWPFNGTIKPRKYIIIISHEFFKRRSDYFPNDNYVHDSHTDLFLCHRKSYSHGKIDLMDVSDI